MIASGQLPRGEVMIALSSDKPMEKLGALVQTYRSPVDIPQKLEERYTYWRKEVDPYKETLIGTKNKVQLVNDALKQGTGQADYFAIQVAQRMADDAVVRKEDVQALRETADVKTRIEGFWQQYAVGSILEPNQRADLAAITKAYANRLRENSMGYLMGARGMADPKVQRRWTSKIVDSDFVKTFSSSFDISTDKDDYKHKKDKTAKTPKKATSAIARKWAGKTMTEVNAAHKAGTLTQKQVELIMKGRGL